MARKKKRKSVPQSPPPEARVAREVPQNPPSAVDAWEAKALREPEAVHATPLPREKKKSGISVATAVAGMFLTLVLGLYVGSLLPGIFMAEKPHLEQVPSPGGAAVNNAPDGQPRQDSRAMQEKIDLRLQQSVADLEKRAAANPASAPDWINLGNIYFDAKMPQKAIQAYEHALSLAPDNADVLTDLGIMYREIGRYEKAVECFRKAVAIDPGHQNALFNAGLVLANDLKLKAEAAAMWEQLLSLNPQAQAPNGVPLADMIKELRLPPLPTPGAAD